MPLYSFKVTDRSARISELVLEGDSLPDAVRRIERRGLIPIECLAEETAAAYGGELSYGGSRRRFDVVEFTDRLVPLLQAHVPLEKALDVVARAMPSKQERATVSELRKGLHEGRRFSQMIRDRRGTFPTLYASLAEAGEEAGALATVLADLRTYLNDRREMHSYVISAIIYPAVVFAVSLVVLGVLLGVIVPRFAGVLQTAGVAMSWPTELLLWVSDIFQRFWWLLPLLPAVCVWLFSALRRSSRFRKARDGALLRVPVIGRSIICAEIGRMFRTMSIMLRRGVHVLDTLRIGRLVLQNQVLADSFAGVAAEVRKGGRLTDALSQSRFIPSSVTQTLAIGEETGELDTMLEKAGERYEQDLKKLLKRAMSLVEPAVILALGTLVAAIVTVMFMAIMDMQGTL